MNKEIKKAQTEGIVFKKCGGGDSEASAGRKPRLADFMRGTHGSASARKKAEYKLKRALRPSQRRGK